MLLLNKNYYKLVGYSYGIYPFKLSLNERFYIWLYTTTYNSKAINTSLRNNPSFSNKQITYIDSGLDKFKLDTEITVYRFEELGLFDYYDSLKKLEQGKYTEKAYISTSLQRHYSPSTLNPEKLNNLLCYEIKVPSTLCGAYISPISFYGIFEQEFLIKRNTDFIVDDVKTNPQRRLINAKVHVKMK